MESEKDTEKYLAEQVEALGGLCRKYVSPGVRGVPDRICLFPKALTTWVELKSENDEPNDGQIREHLRMRNRGHEVWVIDTKQSVDVMIRRTERELFRCV
jgi:hypothetical protein